MTTQDLVRGIDITGLTVVTGSQINQTVDAGRVAEDKGLIIETEDSALDTPTVPDPNYEYEGITPTWWTRYLWKRIHFTGDTYEVSLYWWNDAATEDATLLKWQDVNAIAKSALTAAQAADTKADTAIDSAATAETNAENALTTAQEALAAAQEALTAATAATEALEELQALFWQSGDIKIHAEEKTYSTTVDEGWLLCNGAAVSRETFASLFEAIGTAWGAGDGSTTFNVPDLRGRTIIGMGQGSGLSLRRVTDSGGAETVTLTAAQSGLPAHNHGTTIADVIINDDTGAFPDVPQDLHAESGDDYKVLPGESLIDDAVAAPAAEAHNNMPPFKVVCFIIKT